MKFLTVAVSIAVVSAHVSSAAGGSASSLTDHEIPVLDGVYWTSQEQSDFQSFWIEQFPQIATLWPKKEDIPEDYSGISLVQWSGNSSWACPNWMYPPELETITPGEADDQAARVYAGQVFESAWKKTLQQVNLLDRRSSEYVFRARQIYFNNRPTSHYAAEIYDRFYPQFMLEVENEWQLIQHRINESARNQISSTGQNSINLTLVPQDVANAATVDGTANIWEIKDGYLYNKITNQSFLLPTDN